MGVFLLREYGVVFLMFNTPVTNDGIDYNGDKFLDEKWFYKGGRLKETRLDRNSDKTYDSIFYYDNRELLSYSKNDNDFDGVFETKTFFYNGNAIREEIDTDQNGSIDYLMHFKNGVLDNIEFYNEENGKVRKRQFFHLGKMVSADYDSNGDGHLDVHYEYDEFEEKK